jgi:thiol-disulfide isomerase/thioredoxin
MIKRLLIMLFILALPLSAFAQEDEDVVTEDDVERPTWQTIELTDVNTGETFTLGDFFGKTVFVEPMATWCSNCRSQLRNVASARNILAEEAEIDLEEADFEDIVFIALSVEIGLAEQTLADYTERQGFDWTFAVMPEEMLVEMVDEFGRAIANPPATPHFLIRPDGTYTEMVTGLESDDEVIDDIRDAQATSAPVELPADTEADDAEAEEETTIPQVDRPDWHRLELTDARTGETFTLEDFAGQTVYVEPMATWCSNCRRQLENLSEAQAQLVEAEDDSVVFLALSVETNLEADDLAAYADDLEFDFDFAVMSEEMLVALVDEFGRAAANPPSTPHFIIRADGSYTELTTGFKDAEAILESLDEERIS